MRSGLFIVAAIAAAVTFSSLYYFLGHSYRHFGGQQHRYCRPGYADSYDAHDQRQKSRGATIPYVNDTTIK